MERNLLILFGSETGSAQDVAECIGRQARRRHFHTRVLAMNEYDKESLFEEKLTIFVCSTTGQGDAPTNMKQFWRFLLRKGLPADILGGLECAVFGLGDSSYRNFNYPAKKLFKRLENLGAHLLVERGDGDDQHYLGLDGALVPWLEALWSSVMNRFPLPDGKVPIPDDVLLPASLHMSFLEKGTTPFSEQLKTRMYIPGEFDMTLEQNIRVTAEDHFQDVRHVILRNDSGVLDYEAGDVAVITPQNMPKEIDLFLEQMKWTEYAEKWITIRPSNNDYHVPAAWPASMKFRDLFVLYLDIFGVPRRSFFEMLSYFTQNPDHTERLQELASPEGQEGLWSYCHRPRRTIAEVLFDFQPVNIPFDYIFDLFPPLQPRSFSIASSLKTHPNELHLCIAIVKYKTILKKIRRGVLTKWMSTLQKGDVVRRVHIVKGTMNLPASPKTPLIAIGPGTGVAPMRSFIEERIYHGERDNVLFFGCRHHNKDYYFREEWENDVAQDKLKVFTAFSRDQDNKLYVQDCIREQSYLMWDLIENRGAKVLLSGSAGSMPEQVAYALKQVFVKEGSLSAEKAEEYFNTMCKSGQYQEECWS